MGSCLYLSTSEYGMKLASVCQKLSQLSTHSNWLRVVMRRIADARHRLYWHNWAAINF